MRVSYNVASREFCFEKYGFTAHFKPEFIDKLSGIPRRTHNMPLRTANGHWAAIRLFLDLLKSRKLPLFTALCIRNQSKTEFGEKGEWENALSIFRMHVDAIKKSQSNKSSLLSCIHWWIDQLSEIIAIPRISHVRGFKQEPSNSNTIIDTPIHKDILDSEGEAPTDSSSISDTDLVYNHIVTELGTLEAGEVQAGFHDLGIEEKVIWLLNRRLGKIRIGIENQISDALEVRKSALRTIRQSRHMVQLIDNFLLFRGGSGTINKHKKDLLCYTYDQYRNGLLAWSWYKNGGIQLKNHDGKRYRDSTNVLKLLRKKEGLGDEFNWSDQWFSERIGCFSTLYVPCILLLIFDNYMNVSNALEIKTSALTAEVDGVSRLFWFKKRANSWLFKGISNDILLSSTDIFKILKRATRHYRKICLTEQKDFLVLSYHSSQVPLKGEPMLPRNPVSPVFTDLSKRTLREISGGKWYATPDIMRNSLLLLSGLTGGVETVKNDAQHSDTVVSSGYNNKPAARAVFHEKMREFKEWMETLITLNIDDAAVKLGIDPNKYEMRKNDILKSNFGSLLCKDPRAGVQEGVPKGQVCNKIANCLLCKNKTNLFIESVENITHLFMWKQALEAAEERKEINVLDNINWHFWFRYIEEMIARLEGNMISKKRNAALISDAKNRMKQQSNPYLAINFKEVT